MSVHVRLSSELSLLEHLNLKEESATPVMPSLIESKNDTMDYNTNSMSKRHFHIHLSVGPRWWV